MNRNQERKAAKAYNLGIAVYGLIFSVVWCVIAAAMGAGIMLIFGVPFVGFMVFRLVMCVKMAKKKEQNQDPWEKPYFQSDSSDAGATQDGHCPYCGNQIQAGFAFCPKCGRRL